MDQEAKLETDDFLGVGSRYFDSSADPYPLFDALRAKAPVWRAPWGDIFLSRYDDVSRALADKSIASVSPQRAMDLWSQMPRSTVNDWMLFSEGEAHEFLHQAFRRPFGSDGKAMLHSAIDRVVRESVLEGEIDSECEVVSCFTRSVPERVLCDLIGFPRQDIPLLRDWVTTIREGLFDGRFDDACASAAKAPDEMSVYFAECIDRRLKSGAGLPPLLSGFESVIDRLGIEVAGSNAAMLALAGHETTVHLLGNMLFHLARQPEHWRRLRRDRALVPKAVEETLRLESPLQKVSRVSTQPITIGGQSIAAGSPIVLLIGAANRDPARFEAPHRFDLARRGPPHLAFGRGVHSCLGKALGQMVGSAVLDALLTRWSAIEVAEGGARWIANSSFRGLDELHLRFHA